MSSLSSELSAEAGTSTDISSSSPLWWRLTPPAAQWAGRAMRNPHRFLSINSSACTHTQVHKCTRVSQWHTHKCTRVHRVGRREEVAVFYRFSFLFSALLCKSWCLWVTEIKLQFWTCMLWITFYVHCFYVILLSIEQCSILVWKLLTMCKVLPDFYNIDIYSNQFFLLTHPDILKMLNSKTISQTFIWRPFSTLDFVLHAFVTQAAHGYSPCQNRLTH